MYKEDLTLNNLQWLICPNTNPNLKQSNVEFKFFLANSKVCFTIIYLPTPPHQQDVTQFSKWNLTGLNSEFSFSYLCSPIIQIRKMSVHYHFKEVNPLLSQINVTHRALTGTIILGESEPESNGNEGVAQHSSNL